MVLCYTVLVNKHRHQDKQQRENHVQKSIKETKYKFPKVLS